MICRVTGRVADITREAGVLEVGGLCYEVLVPAASIAELHRRRGSEITLFTIQFLEGNPNLGHLMPRLLGFLLEADRDFFQLFTKVKSVGMRKALRAMAVPTPELAAGIERGDERFLATLPEIGKATAAQMVVQMRGKLERFLTSAAIPPPVAELTDAQRVALEILVQWGDRRADAQRWIAAAVERAPELVEPEAIVRAAYREKSGG